MPSGFKIPRRWRPWARRWRTFADLFPLSQGGALLFVLLGAGGYWIGYKEADMVILVAAAAVLLVAVLAVLCVVEAAWATRRRWKEMGDTNLLQLQAGVRGWSGFKFRPPMRPFVEVTWTWLEPGDVEVVTTKSPEGLVETVLPARRCLSESTVRKIEVRDVLGVAAIRWQVRSRVPVQVVPGQMAINESTLVQSLYAGDELSDPYGDPQGDRVDMRRYSAGDPPRLILWKIFARTRKLMVRVPERALVPMPRTCAYLVAGPGDEPCAGLARVILEGDMLGQGWRFGADGSRDHATTVSEALQLLARSGNPEAQEQCGLSAFLEQARRDGYQSCLVMVPPAQGDWMAAARKAVGSSPLSVTLLSVGGKSSGPVPGWHRYVLYPSAQQTVEPGPVLERFQGPRVTRLLYEPENARVIHYRGQTKAAVTR